MNQPHILAADFRRIADRLATSLEVFAFDMDNPTAHPEADRAAFQVLLMNLDVMNRHLVVLGDAMDALLTLAPRH